MPASNLSSRLARGAATAGFVLACALAPVSLALTPRDGEAVLVLTLWPDSVIPSLIAASGASVLAGSSGGHLVVVPEATPALVTSLYRNGAALVLAAALFGGCLSARPPSSTSLAGPAA